MEEDRSRKFESNYPTVSCLLRLAIIGLLVLAPIAAILWLVVWPWLLRKAR